MHRLAPTLALVLSASLARAGDPPAPQAAPSTSTTSATDDVRALGAKLYVQKLCSSCHSVDGTKLTAPTLKGLWGSRVRLRGGAELVADEAYVRESILNSGAKIVDGFQPVMPNFRPLLTPAEVDALVAFVKSLGAEPAGH